MSGPESEFQPQLVEQLRLFTADADVIEPADAVSRLKSIRDLVKAKDPDMDRNEVRFECDFDSTLPVNGYQLSRIAQNLSNQFRRKVVPGWKVMRGRLRLSLWMKKEEPDAQAEEAKAG